MSIDLNSNTGSSALFNHNLTYQSLLHVKKQFCQKGEQLTLYTGPECPK